MRGDAQDMIGVDDGDDARTGLPVHSLYGTTEASLTPTPAMLEDIDVLVYDVQDVGSRYYTFVWTMVLAMRACAKAGKAFVVLDRPEPDRRRRTSRAARSSRASSRSSASCRAPTATA